MKIKNRKIKILFLSHSPYYNGAEICLLRLVQNLNKELFEPVVIFPNPGPLSKKIESLGIKTYISKLERWVRFEYDSQLKSSSFKERINNIIEIINKEDIDIVHSNTSVILEGAIAAKFKGIPHVWHIHEYLKGNAQFNLLFPLPFTYKIISLLSYKIVTVSNFTKTQFEDFVDTSNIITIFNGVEEIKNTEETKSVFWKNLGVKEGELKSVIIGLLSVAKGYELLLDVASITKEKGYPVKYFWIGNEIDNSAKDFKRKIKKLNLDDVVFYLGFRNDIQQILAQSDLLICPSMIETLSLTILEAMSSGLPVITTDCGGPSEVVVNDETGYVVPNNDPNVFSKKIIELFLSEEKRKNFGENGFKRFDEKYSVKKFTENFESLYNSVIDGYKSNTTDRDIFYLDALMELYEDISKAHWKKIKKL